ncbi:triosephosphate isomerase [alpha proteobacterium AAP81b]|nr:triosephosphate isomerase [alpha proteobacterium AAP81b]
MNGTRAALAEIRAMAARDDLWVAPPFTLIHAALEAGGGRVRIGGQDSHVRDFGAHTGCVSAAMLADLGASFVIVGHSERRSDQRESDAEVRAKAHAGQAAELDVILCVGETLEQRDAGRAEAVVADQLMGSLPDDPAGLIIAYEPVWAIGTGRTPTVADVGAMHAHIRARLVAQFGDAGAALPILYGGSVNPGNAAALLAVPEVGGALVGGASLTAAGLIAIAEAVPD